jgi:hypothetical protein
MLLPVGLRRQIGYGQRQFSARDGTEPVDTQTQAVSMGDKNPKSKAKTKKQGDVRKADEKAAADAKQTPPVTTRK